MDGKFYDVPDEDLQKFEVPRDKVKDLLSKAGGAPPGGPGPGHPGGPHPGSAPVVINIYAPPPGGPPGGAPHDGEVDPYWFYYWWWTNY
jgi:hypothetical protein